jgi:hypothetical protein
MTDYTKAPDQPLDQTQPVSKSTHPPDCRPGRNDVIVSTTHYGLLLGTERLRGRGSGGSRCM